MLNKKEFTELFDSLYERVKNISVAVVYDSDNDEILYAQSWGTMLEAQLDAQVELFKEFNSHEIDRTSVTGFALDCFLNLKRLIVIEYEDGFYTFVTANRDDKLSDKFKKNLLDYLEDKIADCLFNGCD